MSEHGSRDRLDDMAKLWSAPVVPVEDEARVAVRRAPTIDAIGRAIRASHIEKRRMRRRKAVLGSLAAAAGFLLVAGVSLWSGSAESGTESAETAPIVAEPVVRLLSSEGSVEIERNGRSAPVPRGGVPTLHTGDVVVSAAHSSTTVSLTELTEIDVASATRLALEEVAVETPRVRLERGHVGARVDVPHDGTPKLVVETPDATIVVVGTVFTVDVSERDADGDGFTAVAVIRGTVVVQKAGEEIARVQAGQTWTSRALQDEAVEVAAESSEPAAPERVMRAKRRLALSEPASPAGTLALENRLFQRAMSARNRGDDATVVRHTTELIRAFPHSPLVGEARRERDRALERLSAGTEGTSEAP